MTDENTDPGLFEFLDATHRDIYRQMLRLRAVVDAVELQGLNAANRALAAQVAEFFNREARQHHLDEEKHVFPALLDSDNPRIVQTAEQLSQDHGWLEENWLQIAPCLSAAANGNLWFDPAELRHATEVFEALYLDHILLEEAIAYPAARRRLAAHDTRDIGREMARRRFARLAHPSEQAG